LFIHGNDVYLQLYRTGIILINIFIYKNFYNMENLVNKIKDTFGCFAADADAQVAKGNKAAGTRARKASLELEKMLKEFRKESIAFSKN
jgi:hypothetical protein